MVEKRQPDICNKPATSTSCNVMYSVVEFAENDGEKSFEALPTTWITENKMNCFYPPPPMSVKKAVEKYSSPQENWTLFPSAVKYSNDNLQKVRSKRNQYIETSNVETSDSDEETIYGKRKRVFQPSNSQSNCQESEWTGLNSISSSCVRSKTISFEPPPFPTLQLVSTAGLQGHKNTSTRMHEASTSKPVASLAAIDDDENEEPHFGEGIARVILRRLERLGKEVKEIKELLVTKSFEETSPHMSSNLDIKLPFKSANELFANEEQLQSEDKASALVCQLSRIGGTSVKDFTTRVLSHLLTNETAMEFNWAGTKRGNSTKLPLRNCKLVTVIYKAVALKLPTSTQSEIDGVIKSWLRYAKSRFLGKS